MGRSSKHPLSRDRALACVTLNFSISGWGTLRAGRIFAGVGQLLFNFAGLFLIGAWLFKWIYGLFLADLGQPSPPSPAGWLWKWGAASIAISWTWMLITCANLIRQAKAEESRNSRSIPPRLADLPKNNSEQR